MGGRSFSSASTANGQSTKVQDAGRLKDPQSDLGGQKNNLQSFITLFAFLSPLPLLARSRDLLLPAE
jgi:hypothetical protein